MARIKITGVERKQFAAKAPRYCLEETVIKCNRCCRKFKTIHSAQKHFEVSHMSAHICTKCSAIFTRKADLKRHITETHFGIQPYYCNVCNKKFSRKANLNRHNKKQHGWTQ